MIAKAGHQRPDDPDGYSAQRGLDGAGDIQPEDQLEFRDRRDQVALVHAARLVVDVQHAAADHDRDIHGQRDRHGQKILQVIHVRVKLDDLEGDGFRQPVLNLRRVHRIHQRLHLGLQAGRSEQVGVIDNEAQLGRILGVNAPRVLLRNDDRGIDFAGAHVLARLHLVVVLDGGEGLDVGGDGIEGLAHLYRLRSMVVIDHGDVRAHDLAAEGIADDDQLQNRQHQRHDHQRGRAEKLAHLALDDGKHSVHGCAPGRGGMVKTGFTCSSRSWRPV